MINLIFIKELRVLNYNKVYRILFFNPSGIFFFKNMFLNIV